MSNPKLETCNILNFSKYETTRNESNFRTKSAFENQMSSVHTRNGLS